MKKLGAAGLATAVGASAVVAFAGVGAAHAASTPLKPLKGAPADYRLGMVDYDDDATGNVSITAVQDGSDIEVSVTVAQGPNNPALEATLPYRLDAFVRLRGIENTRGVRFTGEIKTDKVGANENYYPDGTTISGKFAGVGAGTYKVTLTDLLLDLEASDSSMCPGGSQIGSATNGSDASCFDAWYNRGATAQGIATGQGSGYTAIELSETVTLTGVAAGDRTGPKVKIGKIAKKAKKVKAIKGTVRDNTAPQTVSIRVVQRVGKQWVAYTGEKWVKAKNKKKAFKRAGLLTDTSVSSGKWKIRVKKIKPGRLVVKYSGTDTLGNVSKTRTKSAKLK